MSVLCDWEIRTLCGSGGAVSPFSMEFVNPASLDVRLGNNLMIEVPEDDKLHLLELTDYTKDEPYELEPGAFCLAETLETFRIPDRISAQFVLKSSRAREGFEHSFSGWIDPGYVGSKLTLELKNNRRYRSLALWPGLRIGQVVFHTMSQTPIKSYSEVGNYNNHARVMPSVAS